MENFVFVLLLKLFVGVTGTHGVLGPGLADERADGQLVRRELGEHAQHGLAVQPRRRAGRAGLLDYADRPDRV